MENQQQEMDLTPEELNARKEEMRKFYEESLPYLSAQCEHDEYLSKIAEARFKRMHYEIQLAMLMQGPSEEEVKKDSEPADKSRNLKRE